MLKLLLSLKRTLFVFLGGTFAQAHNPTRTQPFIIENSELITTYVSGSYFGMLMKRRKQFKRNLYNYNFLLFILCFKFLFYVSQWLFEIHISRCFPPPPPKKQNKNKTKDTILLEDFLFPQPIVWRPDSSVVAGTTTSLERRGSAI